MTNGEEAVGGAAAIYGRFCEIPLEPASLANRQFLLRRRSFGKIAHGASGGASSRHRHHKRASPFSKAEAISTPK